MLRSILCAAAAFAMLPAAVRALDCPAPEKKGQTPGGYTICKPSATGQCGPGRKYSRHDRELVPMCVDGSGPKAQLPSATPSSPGKCAVGEEATTYKGYEICKPVNGRCGAGRRHEPHHRYPDLVVCRDNPHGGSGSNATGAQISCGEHERPVFPSNRSIKPFCEPVGRCGFGRTPVASDVPGKQMCVPK